MGEALIPPFEEEEEDADLEECATCSGSGDCTTCDGEGTVEEDEEEAPSE